MSVGLACATIHHETNVLHNKRLIYYFLPYTQQIRLEHHPGLTHPHFYTSVVIHDMPVLNYMSKYSMAELKNLAILS